MRKLFLKNEKTQNFLKISIINFLEEQWKQLVHEKENALQAAENKLRIKLEDADNKLRLVEIFPLFFFDIVKPVSPLSLSLLFVH